MRRQPSAQARPSRPSGSSDSSDLLRRVFGTLIGRGSGLLLSFGFAVAAARVLDPASRGDFALLQALNGMTLVVANFGVGRAVVYHVGKGLLSPARGAGAAISLALLSGFVGAVTVISGFLIFQDVAFPGIPVLFVVGAVLLATPLLLREYVGGTLLAANRPFRQVLTHAAQPFGALTALIIIAIVTRPWLGGVVLAWTIGILLSGFSVILLTAGITGARFHFRLGDVRKIAGFGLRVYPAILTRFLNLRLDQFLVRVLASSAALGQYAVAVNVGELLFQVPLVMLWALSGPVSSSDRQQSALLIKQYSKFALVALSVLAAVIAATAPFAIPVVFGAEYRPAVVSVLLLLPGMVAYAPAAIMADFFIVQRGRPLRAAAIAGTSVVAGVILNVLLTPRLGAAGASIASTLSYVLMLLTATMLFTKDTRIPWKSLFLVSRADVRAALSMMRKVRRVRNDEPTEEQFLS